MIEPVTTIRYAVYWKNWMGEWTTNGEQYKTRRSAQVFANKIKKSAENGVYTIQMI